MVDHCDEHSSLGYGSNGRTVRCMHAWSELVSSSGSNGNVKYATMVGPEPSQR